MGESCIGITPEDPEGIFEPATSSITFSADRPVPYEWAFRRCGNSDWQYCELDHINCAMAGAFWFDYEGSVEIANCNRFVSLAPGESWSDKVGGYACRRRNSISGGGLFVGDLELGK